MNRQDKPAASFSVEPADRESRPIKVRILDKDVQIGCKSGDEDALLQAAAHVNASMRELRARKPSSSVEKIAIVTAINTAHDLLRARERSGNDGADPSIDAHSAPTSDVNAGGVSPESSQDTARESDAANPLQSDTADSAADASKNEQITETSITSRLKTLNDEMAAILEEQQS